LQQAQMALYKEHGVNPAAGCLPLLIQMPVLIALYNVFNQVLGSTNIAKVVTEINKIVYLPAFKLDQLNLDFFGSNLAVKPSQWQSHGWWLLTIPVITGLLQWYQTKLMTASSKPIANQLPEEKKVNNKAALSLKDKQDPKDAKKSDVDSAAEMQKQMAIISPLMFAYFGFQFPLGLALYWNVFGLFGIMQQLRVNKSK